MQFYIEVTGYLLGMSLDDRAEQKDFRVLYRTDDLARLDFSDVLYNWDCC
ncbi:hypothetical protein [Bacillus paranthracis]|nr:hypothetical protein [Bacillus paranthracis]